jgi:hypothetical protein
LLLLALNISERDWQCRGRSTATLKGSRGSDISILSIPDILHAYCRPMDFRPFATHRACRTSRTYVSRAAEHSGSVGRKLGFKRRIFLRPLLGTNLPLALGYTLGHSSLADSSLNIC